MNKITVDGARFQGIRSGILRCDKCGRNICKIRSGVKSFKLVFVCRCSTMGKVEYNSPKRKFSEGGTAVMKEDRLICPICGEELVTFNYESYSNMGFRIRCGCGAVYDKYKDYSKINRRLKEYK